MSFTINIYIYIYTFALCIVCITPSVVGHKEPARVVRRQYISVDSKEMLCDRCDKLKKLPYFMN